MGSTWSYLDLTALGRQEEWEDSPGGYPQSAPYTWWDSTTSTARLHDPVVGAMAEIEDG